MPGPVVNCGMHSPARDGRRVALAVELPPERDVRPHGAGQDPRLRSVQNTNNEPQTHEVSRCRVHSGGGAKGKAGCGGCNLVIGPCLLGAVGHAPSDLDSAAAGGRRHLPVGWSNKSPTGHPSSHVWRACCGECSNEKPSSKSSESPSDGGGMAHSNCQAVMRFDGPRGHNRAENARL